MQRRQRRRASRIETAANRAPDISAASGDGYDLIAESRDMADVRCSESTDYLTPGPAEVSLLHPMQPGARRRVGGEHRGPLPLPRGLC